MDDAITVSLVETGGFDGAATVEATLFAPSGAELGTRVGTGNAAYTLPEDGTYVLRVRAAPLTATGTYSLEIQ